MLELVLTHLLYQRKELAVLMGAHQRHSIRLLLLRVSKVLGDKRRKDLLEDVWRGLTVSEETLRFADWTNLMTDVPSKLLRFEVTLVSLGRTLQIELPYKLWKLQARVDKWQISDLWHMLCKLYAQHLGVMPQHWLFVLFT